MQLIGSGQRRRLHAIFAGNGGKGVARRDRMVAPGIALVFRDQRDAVVEERGSAGGQM